MGESCPAHTWFAAQLIHSTPWRQLKTRAQASLARHVLNTFTFLYFVTSFPGLFIWGPGQRSSSGASIETSLLGEDRENLRHLPTLSQYLTLSFLVPPPYPLSLHNSPTQGCIKLPQAFVWGSLNNEMTPTSGLIHLTLDFYAIPWETMNTESLGFLWF